MKQPNIDMKKIVITFIVFCILKCISFASNLPTNKYLEYLDLAILEFQDVQDDIDSSNYPWSQAKTLGITWEDFLKKAYIGHPELINEKEKYPNLFIEEHPPQYRNVINSTKRQINKFNRLLTQANNIDPLNEYGDIHRQWIKTAKIGIKRMENSLENIELDYKGKGSDWATNEKIKNEYTKSYGDLLKYYSKFRSPKDPNKYLVLGARNKFASFNQNYEIMQIYRSFPEEDWGGTTEAGNQDVYKIVSGEIFSCPVSEIASQKWQKVNLKSWVADLNGDEINEIIIQWSYAHFAIYALKNGMYYQDIYCKGVGWGEGESGISDIKDLGNEVGKGVVFYREGIGDKVMFVIDRDYNYKIITSSDHKYVADRHIQTDIKTIEGQGITVYKIAIKDLYVPGYYGREVWLNEIKSGKNERVARTEVSYESDCKLDDNDMENAMTLNKYNNLKNKDKYVLFKDYSLYDIEAGKNVYDRIKYSLRIIEKERYNAKDIAMLLYDESGKFFIRSVTVRNGTAFIKFGGDTKYLTENMSSFDASNVLVRILYTLTDIPGVTGVYYGIREGPRFLPGFYTRDKYKISHVME